MSGSLIDNTKGQTMINDKTKEMELLKSISDIDEKFIEEAGEAKVINLDSTGGSGGTGKNKNKIWKIAGTIAACFVVLIVSGTVLFSTGMFRAGNSAESADSADMMATTDSVDIAYEDAKMPNDAAKYKDLDGGLAAAPASNEPQVYNGAMNQEYAAEEGEVFNEGIKTSSDAANRDIAKEAQKAETKLIYTADVYIQTTKYDEEVQKIKALVEKFGGYFESSNTYNGGYYETESYKNGYFRARIPQDKYHDFLSGIDNNSHITNLSENVQDVGEYYFDLESKLKMYRTKEEKLQTLLKKATSLSDIIEIESALTEVQSQINMYQSDINHYDGLIGYSTININIDQVAHVGDGYDQDNSFFARLGRSFLNGLRGFVQEIERFAFWIARNIVQIAIIAVVIILARKFHLIRWIKEHIRR